METSIDPLKIAEQRPDRDHLFRGLSVHHRILKLCEIGQIDQPRPNQDTYWQNLRVRFQQLQDMLGVAIEDLDERNVHALKSNLCEIETLVHETFYASRVSYMTNMAEWTESLLTKFCTSDYDLEATLNHYAELGVEAEYIDDEDTGYHVVLSSKDQTVEGVTYPKGKILPSVFFRDASFHPQFR